MRAIFLSLIIFISFYNSLQYANIVVINRSDDDLTLFFGTGDDAEVPLNSKKGISLLVIDNFSNILWTRRADCTEVKNCSYPVTTVGINLSSQKPDGSLVDLYGISVLEGYNRGVQITPGLSACSPVQCQIDLLSDCPAENQIEFSNQIVACDVRETNNKLFKRFCPRAISSTDDGLMECDARVLQYFIDFL